MVYSGFHFRKASMRMFCREETELQSNVDKR